ncbi:MAG: hypothetical protein ABW275_00405 [Hansschlegelia sp.]
MRISIAAAAAFVAVLAGADQVSAQKLADAPAVDLAAAVGDVGPGWRKQASGDEGMTFVCDNDACGGRGVLGVGQATASPDYVRQVIADPDRMLASYRYGSEESMKPSGCAFTKFDVRRSGERRVQYTSVGECPEGGHAAMTTIFDAGKPFMMSVQVLSGSETAAVTLRDKTAAKIEAAL